MDGLTVPVIIAAMAQRIGTVPGVRESNYPAPDRIGATPSVVLFWGSPDTDTVIDHSAPGHELWLPSVMARIYGARLGSNTPREFAAIDGVIEEIAAAFRTGPDGGGVSRVLPNLPGHLDRCLLVRIKSSLELPYAGHRYYGAEAHFDIKFRRGR